MIRLRIADNHTIVRDGIKLLLTLAPDIEVAREVCNGDEALKQVRDGQFDLLLLDLNMPGISGVDLIEQVRQCRAGLPILVYTMHNDVKVAMQVLRSGASGFVTKDSEPELLLAAIRKVSGGGRFLDPELAEQIALDVTSLNGSPLHSALSIREMEVFRYLVSGKCIKEIAAELGLSYKTVSAHKYNLMQKMKIGSVAELVRYDVQNRCFD